LNEIEKSVLDHIHDFIEILDEDFTLINNEFGKSEINRLGKIAHLGLISKTRPLANHTKLEHAYGTYWLCKQLAEKKPKLVRDPKAFRLAGLLHSIGHLPFSYDIEYPIATLCEIHKPTKEWFSQVKNKCIVFAEDKIIEKYNKQNTTSQIFSIHRWLASYKIARSKEFQGPLGKQIVRFYLNPESPDFKLLNELNRLDYTIRDILYLSIGRLELNMPWILSQFDQMPNGHLVIPDISSMIQSTSDFLYQQVYTGEQENCLRQILEKSIIMEVMNNHISIPQLVGLNDQELDYLLANFKSGKIDLGDSLQKVKSKKIFQVEKIYGDASVEKDENRLVTKSLVQLEMDLVNTNKVCGYNRRKGILVQCTPNPFYNQIPELEWTLSGFIASLVYDMDSNEPQNVLSTLYNAERYLPGNYWGLFGSYRLRALNFLTSLNANLNLNRFDVFKNSIIRPNLPKEDLSPEFFFKNWNLFKQAPQIFASEIEDDKEIVDFFLAYPERWSPDIVNKVYLEATNAYKSIKIKDQPTHANLRERRDRLLEFTAFLKEVISFQENGHLGWVVPVVRLFDENMKQKAECDVIKLYLERVGEPINIELIEVSTDSGPDNADQNRRKLRYLAHRIQKRFPHNVKVKGFFNGNQVVLD
jgi:HD superfamily phosphohydrolase